ncbi:MAG: Zn-ribbon domain-containing OB-fold protein, partial [Pigmentiphaga sp.]
ELAKGKFHLAKCGHCGHVYFPPRVVCPECWTQDMAQLHDTPGVGTLVTFTDLHVTSPVLKPIAPVRMAIVDLDEGVRVLTWLRGPGAEIAQPGQACKIAVEDVLGRKWFTASLVTRDKF